MNASDLLKQLQKQIDSVGDLDVKIWVDNGCKYFIISDVYNTIGCNNLIKIAVELDND